MLSENPLETQGQPKGNPRATQGNNTMPPLCPPARGFEAFRSIQATLGGDSGQPAFDACGAGADRGCEGGFSPGNGRRLQMNTPGLNRVN